jgi:protein O-mannosyl-transferase
VLRAALGLAAGALTALVYRASLDNPLIFDDRTSILRNPSLVATWNLLGALSHDLAHPFVNLSYAIDHAIAGHSSFGYHATNGILHLAVVGLLYGWCTRAFADVDRPSDWAAFFAAAIFGVHPLMGSAVTYASARPELLGAFGFIASITFARRAIVKTSRAAAVLAIAFGAIAVASSRAAMALPLMVFAYDAWVLRAPACRQRLARVYAPTMVLVLAAGAWHVRAAFAADPVPSRGPVSNLLTESIVAWRYLGLFLFPRGQSLVHDVHWVTSWIDPEGLAALAALIATAAAAWRIRDAAPLPAFGILWCLATLAPTTSIVPLRDAMAEPRMYLPAAGLLFAAASALAAPLQRRPILGAPGTIVLAALVLAAAARNRALQDPVDLWRDVVARAPQSWQSHAEYAAALAEAGRCDEAKAESDAARRLNERLDAASLVGASCASSSPRQHEHQDR